MTYTIEQLREKNLIIFEAIMGSLAYGTNTPESDIDIRGVFIQPLDDVLKYGFIDQVSDETNDVIFYELGRFLELVSKNNPNILEMLKVPEDCILYKHFIFNQIEENFNKFLSKKVKYTFAGYAIEQIKKAKGYNKKMNWEEDQMTRKTVIDFCYVIENNGSVPFREWIKTYNINFSNYPRTYMHFGLSKIDHMRDVYAMYDMYYTKLDLSFLPTGIIKDPEKSNDVQTVSIPKELEPAGYIFFNKDGYSSHCKKYLEYETWLKERNPNRVKMNKAHGKNYDSKNMMHVFRLLSMAHELLDGELKVRRSNEEIDKLMKIRRGEYEYDQLLAEAEGMIENLDKAFDNSYLPENPDKEFIAQLLLKIRKFMYFI